jgi:hypothetical protein
MAIIRCYEFGVIDFSSMIANPRKRTYSSIGLFMPKRLGGRLGTSLIVHPNSPLSPVKMQKAAMLQTRRLWGVLNVFIKCERENP